MSATELTLNEAMESVTGFDEIAIEKHMNYDIYTSDDEELGIFRSKPVLMIRCLVFVMQRRAGQSDVEARQTAMGMSVKDVHEYFTADPEEVDPDAPESPEGKDDTPPVGEPESSLSVS